MRVPTTLRRLALIATAATVFAGVPVTAAQAADSVSNVSPTGALNNGDKTVQFDVSASYLAVPPPTVTFVRAADPTDEIEIPAEDVSFSGTHFTVTAPLDDRNPGAYDINVAGMVLANPEEVTSSCSSCFTVLAQAPTITAVTPAKVRISASGTAFTITGTNFAAAPYCSAGDCTGKPTVSVSGSGVTLGGTSAASSTSIPKTITVASGAASGPRDITVTNTDGKTVTCTACLLIEPQVTGVAYSANSGINSYGRGAKNRVLTVNGNGFQHGATVAFSTPAGITINSTDVTSPSSIVVNLTLTQTGAGQPTTGDHDVTVTNPDGGVSNTNIKFNIVAGPAFTAVSPSSRGRGATAQLTITGTDLPTGAGNATLIIQDVVVDSYDSLSLTELKATVTIGNGLNIAGVRDVTIINNGNKGQYVCTACFTIDNLQVNGISPADVLNDGPHSITVSGSGFASDAVVELVKAGAGAGSVPTIAATSKTVNGAGTAVTATFPLGGVAPGTWRPRITNPTSNPGIGNCPCTLNVVADVPTVTAVSPTNRGAGADDEVLTITGTGFLPGAAVTFTNTGVHVVGTPVVTPTQITVTVDIDRGAEDVEAVGTPLSPVREVTVTNTDGASDTGSFTVNKAPTATSLDKTARGRGTSTTVTLTGADLGSNTAFLVSGTGITVGTPVFTAGNGVSTQDTLAALITVASDAPLGARGVSVRNPDGGRHTCTCTLTITEAPTVTSVTPTKLPAGKATTVTITGTGFAASPTVSAGSGVVTGTVTYVSPTTVTAVLTPDAAATLGNRNLTVTNTDAGTATLADALKVITVPGKPTAVSATRGAGQATVTWTAPATDGNDAISGYTVTSDPGGKTATVGGNATEATVLDLTNGTAYTFTVVASNAAGDGAASDASLPVTPATVPDAPTAVSATSENAQSTVSWTAPASNGGEDVTGYTVTSSPGGKTASVGGSATQAVVTGLTNGTAYTFTVVAKNTVGDSVASAPSMAVTPATVPDAPMSVSAAASDASALVTWNAPVSDGGSPVTSYTVTSSPGNHTATTPDGETLSANVTGLTNGTAYTFTVVATNAKGAGAASTASPAVTPFTIPGAPTAVSATAGIGQATVSWTAPESNGGSPVSGYTVTSSPGGKTATAGGDATQATVTGLSNGTAYTFTVVATNAKGDSAPSAASSPVTTPDVPGAPTGVTATRGDGKATVSWTAPQSDGGSAVTGYLVTSSPGGKTAVVNGPGTSADVIDLTNGTEYTFTVEAVNAVGNSAASAPSAAVTPAGAPKAPTAVSGTPGNAAITVSWTAADGNGSPVTSYTVTGTPGNLTKTVTGLSTTFTGLTNGTAYTFTVAATNAVGTGSAKTAAPVTPTWVTGLTETATAAVVSGGTSRLSGKLTRADGTGLVGAPVKIYRRVAPATTYTLVRTVTTGAGGAWSTSFTVTKNTRFQAKFLGTEGYGPSTSPVRLTTAAYRVSASYALAGRTATVTGSIAPNASGRTVYLRHRRADGSYYNVGSATVAADGTYKIVRTFPRGSYSLSVYIPASNTNVAGKTAQRPTTFS